MMAFSYWDNFSYYKIKSGSIYDYIKILTFIR